MSQNKEIKFQFTVDERAAQQARRVIRELIQDAQKLAQTLGGVGMGGRQGGGGGMLSGSVGGSMSQTQMISGINSPGQGGAPKNGLAAVFLENSQALKGLASVSQTSMRSMTEGIGRAVDQQKRSIQSLDDELARLAKRYDDLGSRTRAAMANGLSPDRAQALYGQYGEGINAQQVGVLSQRQQAAAGLAQLQGMQAGMGGGGPPGGGGGGPPGPPGGGGGGWLPPIRNAKGQLFRPGAVGGMLLAGAMAGANELLAQPFDFITAEARSQRALGTMGVATRRGDLQYAAAIAMLDQNQKAELLGLGKLSGVQAFAGGVGGAIGKVFTGDFNAPGNFLRGIENADPTIKEKVRSYIEQKIASDPQFFASLSRFQGEAGSRLAMMRRMGVSEKGLGRILGGERDIPLPRGQALPEHEANAAFEILRGGGRGFARGNLWDAVRGMRGGMDAGAVSDLLTAAAAGGGGRAMLGGLASGIDAVAADSLARAAGGAMRQGGYGPLSGQGLLGPLRDVGFSGGSAQQAYEAQQRASSFGGMGQFLGGSGDPFGQGLSILTANKVAGGDLYKTNALAELGRDPATLFSLMRGEQTALTKSLGLTPEMARQYFQQYTAMDVKSRWAGAGSSPAMLAIGRLSNQFGGDLSAMFAKEGRGDQLITDLGAGMHQLHPDDAAFKTAAIAKQGIAILAGVGRGGRGGRGPGDVGAGGAEQTYEEGAAAAREDEMQTFLKQVGGKDGLLANLSKSMGQMGDVMTGLGNMNVSAEKATQSLMALANAANAASDKLGGKTPGETAALLKKAHKEAMDQLATEQAKAATAAELKKRSDTGTWQRNQ